MVARRPCADHRRGPEGEPAPERRRGRRPVSFLAGDSGVQRALCEQRTAETRRLVFRGFWADPPASTGGFA
eukprot:10328843-Lingulodinium_polyedra.AAC.1